MEQFGADDTEADRWVVEAIIDHRGKAADGRQKSTLEYFVQWQGFNVEDYTWEKEKDVVGTVLQLYCTRPRLDERWVFSEF